MCAGQADLSPSRNATHATGPNTSTGPPRSCVSRTPTTAPPWPTSAQLVPLLCDDVRQAATSAHSPVWQREDFRQAATSAQLPFAKLYELLRHPFMLTTSAPDASIP
jgi:hypothetical protein